MFRPQIQKTSILVMLAFLNLIMVYWALNSYERYPTFGFDQKSRAIGIMKTAINSLRTVFIEIRTLLSTEQYPLGLTPRFNFSIRFQKKFTNNCFFMFFKRETTTGSKLKPKDSAARTVDSLLI